MEVLMRMMNIITFKDDPKYKGYSGGTTFPHINHEDWRAGEIFSANVGSSARGLAKLGAYMSNKGTFNGKTIMSQKTWDVFHGDESTTMDYIVRMPTTFTNGGVAHFTLDTIDQVTKDE